MNLSDTEKNEMKWHLEQLFIQFRSMNLKNKIISEHIAIPIMVQRY